MLSSLRHSTSRNGLVRCTFRPTEPFAYILPIYKHNVLHRVRFRGNSQERGVSGGGGADLFKGRDSDLVFSELFIVVVRYPLHASNTLDVERVQELLRGVRRGTRRRARKKKRTRKSSLVTIYSNEILSAFCLATATAVGCKM